MAGTSSAGSKETIDIGQCKIVGVTVFRDRAEVHRSLIFTPQQRGEYELRIVGLTNCVNVDSIRVKNAADASQPCQILEVGHEVEAALTKSEKIESSAASVLEADVKELTKQVEATHRSIDLTKKQRNLTQSFADSSLRCTTGSGEKTGQPVYVAPSLEESIKVMDFYVGKMEALDVKEAELDEQLETLKEKLHAKRQELHRLVDINDEKQCSAKQIITVLVSVDAAVSSGGDNGAERSSSSAPGECALQISYVVCNASWVPSYDIRVNSSGNTMDFHYFAEVTQKSGEDWTECPLQLSTSNPAIGSSPPAIQPRLVRIKENMWSMNSKGKSKGKKSKIGMRNRGSFGSDDDYSDEDRTSVCMIADHLDHTGDGVGGGGGLSSQTGVTGSGDAGSTTFTVQRLVSIAGDSKVHKVTVAVATFVPQFVHYVVPAESAFVYLQAKAINTSRFPLLMCAENKVSVFLDGNFVSTSRIKQTCSCGEAFTVYVGVDPAVKIDYLPCRTVSRSKGWLSGVEQKKCFHSTVVHNTRQAPVSIIVVEVLPKAMAEKISVELLEPASGALAKAPTGESKSSSTSAISSSQDILGNLEAFTETGTDGDGDLPPARIAPAPLPKDFVTFNKHNSNVVWLKTVQPGEKTEVKFTYRVSWPENSEIEIC